jgi:hypothetical protein
MPASLALSAAPQSRTALAISIEQNFGPHIEQKLGEFHRLAAKSREGMSNSSPLN